MTIIENLLKNAFKLPQDFKVSNADILDLQNISKNINPYGILFTARSGSTFLTHELARTQTLGTPHEWFNWDIVKKEVTENDYNLNEYINSIITKNSSKNNIFGFEINWLQLTSLTNIVNPNHIFKEKIIWFLLRRRNLIAQSISNYIADQSKIFHSYQLDELSCEKLKSIKYDNEAIKKYILNFCSQEIRLISWANQHQIFPINIYYEDVILNTEEIIFLFSNVMKTAIPKQYKCDLNLNPIKKISGEKNIEFENYFRNNEINFIKDILKKRPSVLIESTTI